MLKTRKFVAAFVLGLLMCLALFTTGVFAQSAQANQGAEAHATVTVQTSAVSAFLVHGFIVHNFLTYSPLYTTYSYSPLFVTYRLAPVVQYAPVITAVHFVPVFSTVNLFSWGYGCLY